MKLCFPISWADDSATQLRQIKQQEKIYMLHEIFSKTLLRY